MTPRDPLPDGAPRRPIAVKCPACGGPSVYAAGNPYRPFCSARCQGQDLGAWASEGYRVPARPDPEPDDATL